MTESENRQRWRAKGYSAFIRLFGACAFSIFGIVVAVTPASEPGFNPVGFLLNDAEYGINSANRFEQRENRLEAERLAKSLVSESLDFTKSDGSSVTTHFAEFSSPSQCSPQLPGVEKGVSTDISQIERVADAEKAPKPHKMNEYNFRPDLLSLQCRPDYDYCISTCDRNENGVLDESLTSEMTCVSYCLRQAVACEQRVCEGKSDSIQRSVTKWGFFILIAGVVALFLIPPLGALLFVAGFVVMMFSVSPLMTWVLSFRCT